uniref:histidine kinase n=1 Tax=uncultured bacterium contig00010 TaxID=1181502 RepID=A0A806JYK7_9BACT|nr:hypothetical protein [uncultured bacterium contig00010]
MFNIFKQFKIKKRLLLSFFIIVLFILVVGITGYTGLTSIGRLAVKTIDNVRILNDIKTYCTSVEAGISAMLNTSDDTLDQREIQITRENTEKVLSDMDKYLAVQEQFADIFSPDEMWRMYNAFDLYKVAYIPAANEIFSFLEQDRRDRALEVYLYKLTPIYNRVMFTVNTAFNKNLEHSEIRTRQRNEIAQLSAFLIVVLLLLSLLICIPLAINVSNTIAEEEEKAQASALSKSKFLAKMSHEIRTPMNAITGMAELALREDMSSSAREHTITIKQASANLLSIINDILDFSKIDSGKLEIASNEYLFTSLINDVVNIIRTKIIDSQIRFVVNIDCNIPNALLGDETRIRQILLNLLSNAFKYTEKGSVALVVKGEIHEETVDITFDVSDTGKGIKQENLSRLFEDFSQIDLTGNKGIEGTGLGLAITQGLAMAMDGTVSVSSVFGKGSVFTVTLPQKIRSKEKIASVNNPKEKSVIVYEPRKVYADSIQRTVENLGVECSLVYDEDELYSELKSGKYTFAFIASKIYEKNKDLWLKKFPNVKIILLTGYYDIITDRNLGIISMPAYAVSIANTLNGITGSSNEEINKIIAKFTSPEAKILLVDDINTNLKVAEGLLLPYKMQLDLCTSGPEAIQAVKKKDYDIVFMDHMMPDMDGIEAAGFIREWEKDNDKNFIIVALTANAVSGMKEMFLEKGFNDFLAKPIDVSKLDEILDRWIPQEKKIYGRTDTVFPPQSGRPSFPDIPGVDTDKGFAMTGGTEASYRSVLVTFRRDAEERLPLLQNIPTTETMPVFITQVHALKSASASIGAAGVSNLAAKLESAGRVKDMGFIQKNLNVFTGNLKELADNIRNIIETKAIDTKVDSTTEADLLPLFRELENALKLLRLSEIDRLMEELNQKTADGKVKELLAKISDDVLMTEFDNAILKIQEFCNDKP